MPARVQGLFLHKHSPDRLTEWNWNSQLSLMHWLYNSSQKCCKADSTAKAYIDMDPLHPMSFWRLAARLDTLALPA